MDQGSKKAPLLRQATEAEAYDEKGLQVPEFALYMVYLTLFIDSLGGSISTPVMPFYAKNFGATTTDIGYLFGSWSFASTIFAPLLSGASDRFGRRPILIISLLGAGTAALCQGSAGMVSSYFFTSPRAGLYVFGAARAFSGVWAAVGATARVYITDVTSPSKRTEYLSRVGVVGPFALLFGPGLGGGLAHFGLNVPIVVDGFLTLMSAVIVSQNLPETPAFLKKMKQAKAESGGELAAKGQEAELAAKPPADKESARVPVVVYFLCLSNFFFGICFGGQISMLAIFLNSRFELTPLDVGFVFVAGAVVMISSSVFFVKRFEAKLGTVNANAIALAWVGCTMFSMTQTENMWPTLACSWGTSLGFSICMALGTVLMAKYTVTANRGKIFGMQQITTNCGRMIGPIFFGHMAEHDVRLPFMLAASAAWIGAVIIFSTGFCKPADPNERKVVPGERKMSGYGAEWQDEDGAEEDERQLGKFVADLLRRRHHKWVSRKPDVERMLEDLIPELAVDSKEHYEEGLRELEEVKNAMHASHNAIKW